MTCKCPNCDDTRQYTVVEGNDGEQYTVFFDYNGNAFDNQGENIKYISVMDCTRRDITAHLSAEQIIDIKKKCAEDLFQNYNRMHSRSFK